MTTSLRLNSLPFVRPFTGFPGWPQVMAVEIRRMINHFLCEAADRACAYVEVTLYIFFFVIK